MSIALNSLALLIKELTVLVCPDEDRTEANLIPVLGAQLSPTQVRLVAKFLTDWSFEDLNLTPQGEAYIAAYGRRFPLSSFPLLGLAAAMGGSDAVNNLGLLIDYVPVEKLEAALVGYSKSLSVTYDQLMASVSEISEALEKGLLIEDLEVA